MSLRTQAAEAYIPLAAACAEVGYNTDATGLRNLKRQLRRKGFEVRRVGGAFTVQVQVLTAYVRLCAKESAAKSARIRSINLARWATRRETLRSAET